MAEADNKLSQEESDALREAAVSAADAEPDVDPESVATGVRPWNPGSPRRPAGRLPGLALLNERFTRFLRSGLQGYLRRSIDIRPEKLAVRSYGECLATMATPSCIEAVTLKPLAGHGLVVYEAELILAAVDGLFGGDGRFPARLDGREFTPTERRIATGIVAVTLEEYRNAWSSLNPLAIEPQRSETNPRFADILPETETVIESAFSVTLGNVQGKLRVLLPFAALEPVRDLLTTPRPAMATGEEKQRAGAMKWGLLDAEVEITAPLAHIVTPAAHLMKLKVGDVVALDIPEQVMAEVEGVPLVVCRFGTANGHYALKVEHIQPINDNELNTGD